MKRKKVVKFVAVSSFFLFSAAMSSGLAPDNADWHVSIIVQKHVQGLVDRGSGNSEPTSSNAISWIANV